VDAALEGGGGRFARTRADGEAAQVLGRMGTIEEPGRLCLFLAAEATFTTGVDYILSGGAELAYRRTTRLGESTPAVGAT
jgi:NAD(P)-dependent dehydrogenase (short-subunit alcohol dehydrogenase family)